MFFPAMSKLRVKRWLRFLVAACFLLVCALLLHQGHNSPPLASIDRFHIAKSIKCGRRPVTKPAQIRFMLLNQIYNGRSPFEMPAPPQFANALSSKVVTPAAFGATAKAFTDLLMEVRPKVIVEVGTFLGASLIHMGKIAREMGLDPLLICIDDLRGIPFTVRDFTPSTSAYPWHELHLYQFKKNVMEANLSSSVIPLPYTDTEGLTLLCDMGIQADLVEVDASHDFLSVWNDINIAWRLLKPRTGVLFGHDYTPDWKGVVAAVNLFAKLNNLKVETNGAHWIYRH